MESIREIIHLNKIALIGGGIFTAALLAVELLATIVRHAAFMLNS